MSRPNENPLIPASLAAKGMQRGGATTRARAYGSENGPSEAVSLHLTLVAVTAAINQLSRYAATTDAPAWEAVEAADLLDAAGLMLVQAAAS